MTHDDVRALSAEYALDLLDTAERAAVGLHLASCAACRDYVAIEQQVLEALGRSVPQVAPPAALRARVLEAAAAPGERATPGGAAKPRPVAMWLIAASVLLMVAAGAWQVLSTGDRAREIERAEQSRTLAIVAADDLVRFDLNGAETPARARALWSRRHGMVFSAEGLAPLPAGRTYQLWVISGGAPISAGVFETDADGRARVVVPTPEALTAVEAVAVTIEPEGGLPAPSTTPILAGPASTSD